MPKRYTGITVLCLALMTVAIVVAGNQKQAADGQFENLLSLSDVSSDINVEEIVRLPRLQVGDPFVLTTTDKKIALLCHCTEKHEIEIVKVLFDYSRKKK